MSIQASDYYNIVYGTAATPASRALSQAIPEVLDANGDGIGDILLFGAYYPFNGSVPAGQPSLLMQGKGDGSYSVSNGLLPAGLSTIHPREVVQGDFNEDGRPDLFIASHGYDVSPFPGEQNRLLLSSATGGYTEASAGLPQLADFTHSAAAADINGDGHLDLFVGNMSGPASQIESYVLFGDGKGQFQRADAGLPVQAGGFLNRTTSNFGITASLLTDLNGDGKPDLVLGNDGNPYNKEHRSLVYWNSGAGFDAAKVSYLPAGYFGDARLVHDIAAIDIDADGDQDLLLLSSEALPTHAYADGWSLEVLRNDKGSFVDATSNHFSVSDSREGLPNTDSNIGASEFIRLIDVNRDGAKDIVITQFMNDLPSANTPVVWTNDGFGHFEVALRAGQLATLSADPYFFSGLSVPVPTADGLSFTKMAVNGDTIYTVTALASKPLPGSVAILATAGNDRIVQNANSNLIDGGAGLDTVLFAQARAGYTIKGAGNSFTVQHQAGADGSDTLVSVERARFSDTSIAFDLEGAAGKGYRLYRAAFNRESDLDGLGYWIGQLDQGVSLQAVSSGFVNSDEFRTLYGANASHATVLTAFYNNVLHRVPDKAGYDYWLGALASGMQVEQMLIEFSESGENKAQVIGTIQNGIEYHPYG